MDLKTAFIFDLFLPIYTTYAYFESYYFELLYNLTL